MTINFPTSQIEKFLSQSLDFTANLICDEFTSRAREIKAELSKTITSQAELYKAISDQLAAEASAEMVKLMGNKFSEPLSPAALTNALQIEACHRIVRIEADLISADVVFN